MIQRFNRQPCSAFVREHACVFTRVRIAWCALIFIACAAVVQGADVSREYQIKAAFLYNFAKFVEWPAARFENEDAPIVIGVLGDNPFGAELEKIVQDRKVNGRPVSIVMLNSPAEVKTVHLLFVSAGHERRFAGSEALKCPGVLTVGESQNFAAAGGTITFTMPDDKVKFEINMGSANCAELRISAQLLKLAAVVRKKS